MGKMHLIAFSIEAFSFMTKGGQEGAFIQRSCHLFLQVSNEGGEVWLFY